MKRFGQTIEERQAAKSGMIEENRLYNNLLSSQPLCFNFFGELKLDTALALQVLRQYWPALTNVNRVMFEFAPADNYLNDNSAFDVAFEVMMGKQRGLLGLECKYTDTFSQTRYDKAEYRSVFEQNATGTFVAPYEAFVAPQFNQLFRNQLIAEVLLQNNDYDFVHTGLFCHPADAHALETGAAFQHMLKNGCEVFRVITYQNFIETMQRLEVPWEQRELSMLLWTRYCGTRLSEQIFA